MRAPRWYQIIAMWVLVLEPVFLAGCSGEAVGWVVLVNIVACFMLYEAIPSPPPPERRR